jgi:hypothetical protein
MYTTDQTGLPSPESLRAGYLRASLQFLIIALPDEAMPELAMSLAEIWKYHHEKPTGLAYGPRPEKGY